MSKIDLYNADCFDILPKLEDASIDMVLVDPPYGTTALKWDKVLDIDKMWSELTRAVKPRGCIAIFGSQPFTSLLICSNLDMYKYNWVWKKTTGSGFLTAKLKPIKLHEEICIFSKGNVSNNPRRPELNMNYFPQGLIECNKPRTRKNTHRSYDAGAVSPKFAGKKYTQKYTNYPTSLLKFKSDATGYHPTQKPVALLEYLIKTYTLEGQTVLDFTMGSGSTGVACINTNRKFIGIEKDSKYFEIAEQRIEEAKALGD